MLFFRNYISIKKFKAVPRDSARSLGERFFVKARFENAGRLCAFQVLNPPHWRKRSGETRRRIVWWCLDKKPRPYCHRGEVKSRYHPNCEKSHLSRSVSGAPAGVLLRMLETGCIKARRRAFTCPLLSKGCCLMLGSSLQFSILRLFYHKLRQCQ